MKKILLVGDHCTDIFIYGNCSRLNPEAPSPVFKEVYRTQNRGMAGNVFDNLKALGLEGMTTYITHKEGITKTRYVEIKSNYILLRIDNENTPVPIENIQNLKVADYDLVIISDYDKGYLSACDIEKILSMTKLSFIDTKKPIDDWIKNASFIKINEAEYKNVLNNKGTLDHLEKDGKLVVTISEKGTRYGSKIYSPVRQIHVRDIVGAGDTFLASLASHYLLHRDITDAIKFANLCSGQVVEKKGIAYPEEKLVL